MGLTDRLFGKKKVQDPMSRLNLEEKSLKYEGTKNGVRVWYTADGDGIGLHYFGIPPDLPREQPTIEAFCTQYRAAIQAEVVEVRIQKVADLLIVRTIGKVAQSPTGMTYVGSYTIPFRDFSYVIKIQCEEREMTGIREAILVDKGLKSGDITTDDSGNIVRNLVPDDEVYDKDFPNHPLSRCRRGLCMIASSLCLSEELKRHPRFALPNHS